MAKKKKKAVKKVKKVVLKTSDTSDLEADFYNYALNNPKDFNLRIDDGGWGYFSDIIVEAKKKNYILHKEYISLFLRQKDNMKIRGLKFLDNGYVKSVKDIKNDISNFKKLKNEKNN